MWSAPSSESANWGLLAVAAVLHLAWLLAWRSYGRRLEGARPVDPLASGPSLVEGVVARTGVPENTISLVLPSGPELLVDTSRIRFWAARVRATEAVRVYGEMRRRTSANDAADDRTAPEWWILEAASIQKCSAPDPVARARRRSTLAVRGGSVGLLAHALIAATFVILSVTGRDSVGYVEADPEATPEVTVRIEGAPPAEDELLLSAAPVASGPTSVRWADVAGTRVAYIGGEPRLPVGVQFLLFLELAIAAVLVANARSDGRRISRRG